MTAARARAGCEILAADSKNGVSLSSARGWVIRIALSGSFSAVFCPLPPAACVVPCMCPTPTHPIGSASLTRHRHIGQHAQSLSLLILSIIIIFLFHRRRPTDDAGPSTSALDANSLRSPARQLSHTSFPVQKLHVISGIFLSWLSPTPILSHTLDASSCNERATHAYSTVISHLSVHKFIVTH